MESFSKLYWNVMECLPTSPSLMPWSADVTRWAVNQANVEISSNCACMHQNLTWLDKTPTFIMWEGFKAQGYLTYPQNIWDHPRLLQCSSCSLMVIIRHSHQQNLCRNSIEMSWNTFQQAHHQCHDPLTSHIDQWMGTTLKFLELVHACIEIWHG